MSKKIKLFTHTDLDGVGCAIILSSGEKPEDKDIVYCNYDDVNQKVNDFLNSGDMKEYSYVYITDISVNKEIAEKIEEYNKKYNSNILLFDHHKTAEWLNEYEWASVIIEKNGIKQSGTSLFGRHFKRDCIQSLSIFIELVRSYDTWDWSKSNNLQAKQLTDLLYIKGRTKFIEDILIFLDEGTEGFISPLDFTLLNIEEEKRNSYIKKKQKEIISKSIFGYDVGIVFANQYISELGNKLSKENSQYDLIALIGNNSVSYRTVKDNVDVGAFAKKFGGGGHAKTSGNPISSSITEQYIDLLFGGL